MYVLIIYAKHDKKGFYLGQIGRLDREEGWTERDLEIERERERRGQEGVPFRK